MAHRKKHWLDNFDLTNKSYFPEYKWDWFENRVSGDTGWGNSKVDHGLGNERGENSHIYGSWDNEGLGINRPGAGAGFKSIQTEINRMANFMRGFRLGRGSIKHSTTLYDEFKPKTQFELDSIRQDSVFMNEPIEITRQKFLFGLHRRREWGLEKEPETRFIYEPIIIIRKDSAKTVESNQYKYDSIRKHYGVKD